MGRDGKVSKKKQLTQKTDNTLASFENQSNPGFLGIQIPGIHFQYHDNAHRQY
jgi:hypothetical protein